MTTAATPDRRRHFKLIAAVFTALLLPAHGKEGDSGVARTLTPAGATRVVQAHVRSLFEGRIEKMARNDHRRVRLMPGQDAGRETALHDQGRRHPLQGGAGEAEERGFSSVPVRCPRGLLEGGGRVPGLEAAKPAALGKVIDIK